MAAQVFEEESAVHAAQLFQKACSHEQLDPSGIVLHSDNGSPMKGATMLATLQRLGVVTSFSRPRVSDDNPYSEALFRTLKYRPEYPPKAFTSLDAANLWVQGFVRWYNTEHRHSAIRYVTPEERHNGRDVEILAHRGEVYRKARKIRPERWSRSTRNWTPVATVSLNPAKRTSKPPAPGRHEATAQPPTRSAASESASSTECDSSRLTEKGWRSNPCPSAAARSHIDMNESA